MMDAFTNLNLIGILLIINSTVVYTDFIFQLLQHTVFSHIHQIWKSKKDLHPDQHQYSINIPGNYQVRIYLIYTNIIFQTLSIYIKYIK